MGLGASDIAALISSGCSALPAITVTTQPELSNSRRKALFSADPALRERKTRERAPSSTNQVEITLPNPPNPPVRRYEESLSNCSLGARGSVVIAEKSAGMVTTALPTCSLFCRWRKAARAFSASNNVTGWRAGILPAALSSTIFFKILRKRLEF